MSFLDRKKSPTFIVEGEEIQQMKRDAVGEEYLKDFMLASIIRQTLIRTGTAKETGELRNGINIGVSDKDFKISFIDPRWNMRTQDRFFPKYTYIPISYDYDPGVFDDIQTLIYYFYSKKEIVQSRPDLLSVKKSAFPKEGLYRQDYIVSEILDEIIRLRIYKEEEEEEEEEYKEEYEVVRYEGDHSFILPYRQMKGMIDSKNNLKFVSYTQDRDEDGIPIYITGRDEIDFPYGQTRFRFLADLIHLAVFPESLIKDPIIRSMIREGLFDVGIAGDVHSSVLGYL